MRYQVYLETGDFSIAKANKVRGRFLTDTCAMVVCERRAWRGDSKLWREADAILDVDTSKSTEATTPFGLNSNEHSAPL